MRGTKYTCLVCPGLLLSLADGDEILAGFSRGAHQVQALAGMIHEASTRDICRIDGLTFMTGRSGEGEEERTN